ncbi:MAG: hypothetical protein ACM3UU_02200 [Ignavibacteriales bacterium]
MGKTPAEKGYYVDGALAFGFDERAFKEGKSVAFATEIDASQPNLETFENTHAIIQDIGDHELNPRYITKEQERDQEQQPISTRQEQVRSGQEPIQASQVQQPVQDGPNMAELNKHPVLDAERLKENKDQTIDARSNEQNKDEKPRGPEINPKDSSIFSMSRQQAAPTVEQSKTPADGQQKPLDPREASARRVAEQRKAMEQGDKEVGR